MTSDGPAAQTPGARSATHEPAQIADPGEASGEASTVPEDPRVAAALERLAELDALPLADQVAVFRDIHTRLHDALADLGPEA